MELAEICKHDNLTNVISIIHKWETISILNKNIKGDKKFLRGLSWIKKLKGNYMLYLLKDSEDLETACQRFLVNNSEIKILEDYLNTKRILNTNQKISIIFLHQVGQNLLRTETLMMRQSNC